MIDSLVRAKMPLLIIKIKDSRYLLPDMNQTIFYNESDSCEIEKILRIGGDENYSNFVVFVSDIKNSGIGVLSRITDTSSIEADQSNDSIQPLKIMVEGIQRVRYSDYDELTGSVTIELLTEIIDADTSNNLQKMKSSVEKIIQFEDEDKKNIYRNILNSELLGIPDAIIVTQFNNITDPDFDLDKNVSLAQSLMGSEIDDRINIVSDYIRSRIKTMRACFGDDLSDDEVNEAEIIKAHLKRIPTMAFFSEKYALSMVKMKRRIKSDAYEMFHHRLMSIKSDEKQDSHALQQIESVLGYPWGEFYQEDINSKESKDRLMASHYGMDEVKKKILEHLAVINFLKDKESEAVAPIICLVGPPGVGKTSIAKSVAASIGRKFVRISMSGVDNESIIRGHRRTYVGATAGKIVGAIKKTKVENPVMLFDEIDKIGVGGNGSCNDALLEVFDREQNSEFEDHYMEVPIDLSRVLFICTANYEEKIPEALRDRILKITIPGYTVEDKINICKNHLIPKAAKKYGLDEKIAINAPTIKAIIKDYTREAGVRGLTHQIESIFEKIIYKVVFEDNPLQSKYNIGTRDIVDLLGQPEFKQKEITDDDKIGRVNGLAWTSIGGTTLPLEVSITQNISGRKLIITGNLGKVMEESMTAAITVSKNLLTSKGIDVKELLLDKSIHIHAPQGAIPKDGPSAGITATTGIISAATNIPVRKDVAMTGEVSLLGDVLPIGGLKEKLIAALEIGIKTVIIPFDNKIDYSISIESEPKISNLEVIFVKDIAEVIDVALVASVDATNNRVNIKSATLNECSA